MTAGSMVGGCTLLPAEFNLSPIYRHRMAEDGTLLELDFAWPIVHYERTPEGGSDFRIRPIYRRVTEPDDEPELTAADGNPDFGIAATEHQFLWPFGRIRSDDSQTMSRLWPLWWQVSRSNTDGLRETDWYALFPFFWGGSREDGAENYFALFPLYADIPQFVTYDRMVMLLFPLYVGLDKQGRSTHMFLWPFTGFSTGPDGYWHRILPLYSWESKEEHQRLSIAWPFLHWGRENLDTDDPVTRYLVWPLFGQQWSESGHISGWTALWPFFQYISIKERLTRLDLFWPIFRFEEDLAPSSQLMRWWVFPFVARTVTGDQWAWNFLWPLIWLREYADPDGVQTQRWIVPFLTRVHRDRKDGTEDDLTRIWPLWHHETTHDGRSEWSVLSLLLWRAGNTYGFSEAYDFLWTLAKGKTRAPDDQSVELAANLYTSRTRGERTQASVPFLFNYESDSHGSTLRLFQFLPIPLSGDAEPDEVGP
ncbi:MAG: hypothetical protein KDB80_10730 [Planctomycetes bacterium]|nr:hypothetical protein [Planctomycetota bacterium]